MLLFNNVSLLLLTYLYNKLLICISIILSIYTNLYIYTSILKYPVEYNLAISLNS